MKLHTGGSRLYFLKTSKQVKLCANSIYTLLLFAILAFATGSTALADMTWTQATAAAAFPGRFWHTSVAFNGKLWVIGGYSNGSLMNDVWSSSDGIAWTQETAAAAFPPRYTHSSVVFDNKIWVIAGYGNSGLLNDVWSSPDGINWTQETASAAFPPRIGHSSAVFNNKLWVIGGNLGTSSTSYGNDVWSSSDGVNWIEETASAAFSARGYQSSVVFNNKLWVIGGIFGNSNTNDGIWSSPDGITWTLEAAMFTDRYAHASVVFNNKLWLISGYNGNITNDVWSSSDGAAWTQETAAADFPARYGLTGVVFNNSMWIIAGADNSGYRNDVWYSGPPAPVVGMDWFEATSSAAFPPRVGHESLVYDNKMWIIGGYPGGKNDVWSSSDGIDWTQVTSSASFAGRDSHASVVYDGKMWVIGGYNPNGCGQHLNDVWWSTDGSAWTLATAAAPWAARGGHACVVFDGKIWLFGGWDGTTPRNDVWWTTDGTNWTQATVAAGFGGRYDLTGLVFDGRMWAIAGYGAGYLSDVWSSTDGVNWSQVTPSAAFGARSNYGALVFDNKMWISGGENSNGQDVWSSADGANWTQVTAAAAFSPRQNFEMLDFNNVMWVIGNLAASDVWYSGTIVTPTPTPTPTATPTPTPTPAPALSDLGSANIWFGLKNSDSVGAKFDLYAEVLKNGTVVGSGQLNAVAPGSSGFNNANLQTIALDFLPAYAGGVDLAPGDSLGVRVSARIAVGVSGHSSGAIRLWCNTTDANSRFDVTIASAAHNYYLLGESGAGTQTKVFPAPVSFTLGDGTPGTGPKNAIDLLVNKNIGGNPFKPIWNVDYHLAVEIGDALDT